MKNFELKDIPIRIKEDFSKFIYAFVVFIIIFVIAKIIQKTILYRVNNISNNNKDKLYYIFVANWIYYIMVFIAIIIFLSLLGINLSSILIVLGSVGIALALAIQSTITQIVSGFLILFFNLFNINDIIEVNNIKGYVKNFNLLQTTITLYNIDTIIPNQTIINNPFINYTSQDIIFHIVYVTISSNNSIDYNILMSNIENKIKMESKYYIKNKELFVQVKDISASGTNLIIKVPIKSKDMFQADYEIRQIIRNTMSEDNVLLLDNAYFVSEKDNKDNKMLPLINFS